MKRRLTLLSIAFATLLSGAHAAPNCQFEKLAAGSGGIGRWIDKGNWLAVENQRLSLSAGEVFMPVLRLAPIPASEPLRPAPPPLVVGSIGSTDPPQGRPPRPPFLLARRPGV